MMYPKVTNVKSDLLIVGLGPSGYDILTELKLSPLDGVDYLYIGLSGSEMDKLKKEPTGMNFFEITPDLGTNIQDYASLVNYKDWLSLDTMVENKTEIKEQEDRVLARLAFFGASKELYRQLYSFIRRDLQVFIVGSLSCGLASGTFIDIAYLIRSMFKVFHEKPKLAGAFILSAPFEQYDSDRALGNSYASLRELNHYQDPNTVFRAQYAFDSDLTIKVKGRPFDFVYLLNSSARYSIDVYWDQVWRLGKWLSLIIGHRDLDETIWQTNIMHDENDWLRTVTASRTNLDELMLFPIEEESNKNANKDKQTPKEDGNFTDEEKISGLENLNRDISFDQLFIAKKRDRWFALLPRKGWAEQKKIENAIRRLPQIENLRLFLSNYVNEVIIFREIDGFQLSQLRDLNLRQSVYYALISNKRLSFRLDDEKLMPLDALIGNPAKRTNLSLFPATLGGLEIGNIRIRITDEPIDELQVDMIATDKPGLAKYKRTPDSRMMYPLFDEFQYATVYSFNAAIRTMVEEIKSYRCSSVAICISGIRINIHRAIEIISWEIKLQMPQSLEYVIIFIGDQREKIKDAINLGRISYKYPDEEVLLNYPFPIAHAYRRLWFSRTWNRETGIIFTKTLEAVLKFAGIITLADYSFSNLQGSNAYILKIVEITDKKNGRIKKELGGSLTKKLTGGDWYALMQNLNAVMKKDPGPFIVPEAMKFFEGLDRDSNLKRNIITHDVAFSDAEVRGLYDILETMLIDLSWLEDYSLVNIGQPDETEKGVECQILSGWDMLFQKGRLESDQKLDPGIALINISRKRILYLSPYIIFKDTRAFNRPFDLLWIDHIQKSINKKEVLYQSWLNEYKKEGKLEDEPIELGDAQWSFFDNRFLSTRPLERNYGVEMDTLRLIRDY